MSRIFSSRSPRAHSALVESPSPQNPPHFPRLDYLLLLGVCHTVVIDPDTGSYQASSPDEAALVLGAAKAGVKLIKVSFGDIVIELPDGSKREYKLRELIEFR